MTVTTSTTIPFNKRGAPPPPARCNNAGFPTQLQPFGCDVISQACSRYVQPRTSTVTATLPGSTSTSTVTVSASCAAVTPTVTSVLSATGPTAVSTVYTTNTPAPVTTTVYSQVPPTTVLDYVTLSVTGTSTSTIVPTSKYTAAFSIVDTFRRLPLKKES